MKTAFLREITQKEITTLEAFLDLIKVSRDYYKSKPSTIDEYNKFKKQMSPFLKFPFAKKIREEFAKTDKHISKYNNDNDAKPKNTKAFSSQYNSLKDLYFNKGSIDDMYTIATKLKTTASSINDANIQQTEFIGKTNPFEISPLNSFFSGGKKTGLLSQFTDADIDDLTGKDLSKFKYAYLKLPNHDDYQYMVYFINKLQDSKDPIEVSSTERKYMADFKYATNADYKALDKLVDTYLFNNDKKVIQEILTRMKQFPELVNINNSLKQKTKRVYRGIPEQEHFGSDINKYINEDKRTKIVATSTSAYAAKNFAKAKGHLDSVPNSKAGVIIVYKTKPSDIILHTSIFGSAFGESEILIDASKATVENTEFEYWDDYTD